MKQLVRFPPPGDEYDDSQKCLVSSLREPSPGSRGPCLRMEAHFQRAVCHPGGTRGEATLLQDKRSTQLMEPQASDGWRDVKLIEREPREQP